MADDITRGRYIGLERCETAVHGGRARAEATSSHRATKCAAFACREVAVRDGRCEWHAARAEVGARLEQER